MDDKRRQSRASRIGRLTRTREQAFALPLVVPAALLLIIGAATLVSRSTNSYLTATNQSDAQAARQAAESGMNRVMGLLNPYAKYRLDPYFSFLLASKWNPGEGVNYVDIPGVKTEASGWSLTTLGQTQVQDLLEKCGLSKRGQHPDQKPPETQQLYQDLLSAHLGNAGAVSRTQLFYRVTNYVAPERPAMTSTEAWPDECKTFTTAAGGSAQLSVEGLVVRRNRLVARYSLTRTFDVEGWPLPNLTAAWLSNRDFNPGPPISLRVGRTGTRIGDDLRIITPKIYTNFTASLEPSPLSSANSKPQCANCNPDSSPISPIQDGMSASDIIPPGDTDLPRFPFNTDSVPTGITVGQISNDNLNYPYSKPNTTQEKDLLPECAPSRNIQSGRPDEIDCWIDGIGSATVKFIDLDNNKVTLTFTHPHRFEVNQKVVVDIRVGPPEFQFNNVVDIESLDKTNTQIIFKNPNDYSGPPIQKEYSGDEISQARVYLADPTNNSKKKLNLEINTQASPVNLIVRKNIGEPDLPVALVHKISTSGTRFDHTATSTRFRWNRLRIFGLKPTTSSCASDQSFFVRATPATASLNGAFVWLPRGLLSYGAAGDETPNALLGSWWVCDLTTTLSQGMTFIMPLYGNPDALTPILPGGYLSASGFSPDLRFPVYPSLQRIRSAF